MGQRPNQDSDSTRIFGPGLLSWWCLRRCSTSRGLSPHVSMMECADTKQCYHLRVS